MRNHFGFRTISNTLQRIESSVQRWIAFPVVWFVLLPLGLAIVYWYFFHSLAFTDGSPWRIPALPKVFFDQTMYMQVLAKDLLHGFHILPFALRPFLSIARFVWPAVSLSELYVLGIIISSAASLWLFSAFIRHIGGMDPASARIRSIAAFFLVQSILVLRPGGPSWYVPFFLAALLLVWIGESAWNKQRPLRAAISWIAAVVLSSVYPWYFAVVVVLVGLLFLLRFVRPHYVIPGVIVGLLLAALAFVFRDQIVNAILSSYAVLLAYYGGVQFSHLTTLSNTIVLMFGWVALWLPAALRDARNDSRAPSSALFFLITWAGLLILWFQSLLSGLSIVPDHFIYPVWIVSALSFSVWRPPFTTFGRERNIRTFVGVLAAVYALSIIIRIAFGTYAWTTYPSLVIHIGSWLFLAFAALPISRSLAVRAVFLLGICSALFGAAAVWSAAHERADIDREMDGVRAWIMETRPSTDLRWCSDELASDYIFSVTGADSYPNFSNKHDPVSITQLQNRMVDISAFFNPVQAGELYMWDDMILHDLDFPCRVFGSGIRIVNRLPLLDEVKIFINGCDQEWADAERARIIAMFEDRWQAPVPEDSVLCDRFIVRKRLENAWRIPDSYELLYEDENASVYGRETSK